MSDGVDVQRGPEALTEAEHPRLLQPPAPPDPAIREADFQRLVVDLAERLGWWTYHPLDSRGSNPGWPDLVLARWPRAGGRATVIFRELKTERGKVRPEQLRWGQTLMAGGLDWQIWRPSMWPSICDELARR